MEKGISRRVLENVSAITLEEQVSLASRQYNELHLD